MARKFLYLMAVLISLAVAGMIAFSFYGETIMTRAMVPGIAFSAQSVPAAPDYANPAAWASRPDGRKNDPALWRPAVLAPAPQGDAAIFFVHPTSAFETTRWNAPANDPLAAAQADRWIRADATALNGAGTIWAPRYRQAVFGAFLTETADATHAIDLAYEDVARAFAAFLKANPEGPVILAGHSQGSLHLIRLIAEHVAGRPVARRIVAAYVAGWPISVEADLPALDLPACTGPDQAGCILSWQSFAPPATPAAALAVAQRGTGYAGLPRKGTRMLCVNPLTGGGAPSAPGSASLGVLTGDGDPDDMQLAIANGVGAACDARGLLMLESAPNIGTSVLPGNNYHVYDYPLFWANIRADATRRLAAWRAR